MRGNKQISNHEFEHERAEAAASYIDKPEG